MAQMQRDGALSLPSLPISSLMIQVSKMFSRKLVFWTRLFRKWERKTTPTLRIRCPLQITRIRFSRNPHSPHRILLQQHPHQAGTILWKIFLQMKGRRWISNILLQAIQILFHLLIIPLVQIQVPPRNPLRVHWDLKWGTRKRNVQNRGEGEEWVQTLIWMTYKRQVLFLILACAPVAQGILPNSVAASCCLYSDTSVYFIESILSFRWTKLD